MDKVRFIYKSHLLPPVVMPFQSMYTYMRKVYPRQYGQLKNLSLMQRKKLLDAKRAQMISVNQVLLKQAQIYKEKYIFPLKNSPSYYEELDKVVCSNLIGKTAKEDYLKQIETIPITTRLKCLKKVQTNYRLFKQKLSQNQKHAFNELAVIPIFVYKSSEDLAQKHNKKWADISQSERNDYDHLFIKLIQEYNQQIEKVSGTAGMAKKQLLKAMTQFLQYSHTSNIKLLLLS